MPRYFLLGLLLSVYSYSGKAQHLYTLYNNGNSPLPDNTIRSIALGPDSSIWIGTDFGLCRLKEGNWNVYQTNNSGLPDNSVRTIAFDQDNNVWVGTFLGGLAILSDTGWAVYSISNSRLPDNHVRAIAFDTAGLPWIGTTGGLVEMRDTGWHIYTSNNSPMWVNSISSIYIDPNNKKWIGTTNGGLATLVDTSWIIYRIANSEIPDNTIMAMEPGDNGILWCAFPAVGAGAFNGTDWLNFNIVNSNNPSNALTNLSIAPNGHIFFSSLNEGLIRYRGGLIWDQYATNLNPDTANEFLPEDNLLCVLADIDSSVWIGTSSQGLVHMQYVSVIDDTTGLATIDETSMVIFPNPSTDFVSVRSKHLIESVEIVDLHSKKWRTLLNITTQETTIPLDGLPSGMYMMGLAINGQKIWRPFQIISVN
ncbi:MAG: two-component regulator propeller domain-containing protein [Chitinophagales bacterium]|nr:two-component regulator propeller domain-containing protein [Chitinophagales bacterium]